MIYNSHNSVAHSLRILENRCAYFFPIYHCKSSICAFECAMRNRVAQHNAQQIEMFEEFNYAHSQPSIEGALDSAPVLYGSSAQWQDRLLICGVEIEGEEYL